MVVMSRGLLNGLWLPKCFGRNWGNNLTHCHGNCTLAVFFNLMVFMGKINFFCLQNICLLVTNFKRHCLINNRKKLVESQKKKRILLI